MTGLVLLGMIKSINFSSVSSIKIKCLWPKHAEHHPINGLCKKVFYIGGYCTSEKKNAAIVLKLI